MDVTTRYLRRHGYSSCRWDICWELESDAPHVVSCRRVRVRQGQASGPQVTTNCRSRPVTKNSLISCTARNLKRSSRYFTVLSIARAKLAREGSSLTDARCSDLLPDRDFRVLEIVIFLSREVALLRTNTVILFAFNADLDFPPFAVKRLSGGLVSQQVDMLHLFGYARKHVLNVFRVLHLKS